MGKGRKKVSAKAPGWLLFFYRVPSKPVSSRMKVWRRLMKAGAVPLKGTVYVLPFSDEHYEFLQWLVTEIADMKGEAAFTRIERIDTMKDHEIIALFDLQRAADYKAIERAADDLERRLSSIPMGTRAQDLNALSEQLAKILKDFEEVKRIDFFSSREGSRLSGLMKRLGAAIKRTPGALPAEESASVVARKRTDYQRKTWLTRKKPFVDRMASAWLIKRFIDGNAAFAFVDEKDVHPAVRGSVAFDMRGGEFTHVGDLCTFEVLIRSFGLKDKALKKMAETVHELDIKDDKYKAAGAKGLEDILTGIRKTAANDREALKAGMRVFELLYASHL